MKSAFAFCNLLRVRQGFHVQDLSLVYLRAEMIRTRKGARLSIFAGAGPARSACPPN
jgi:hypothetical protein